MYCCEKVQNKVRGKAQGAIRGRPDTRSRVLSSWRHIDALNSHWVETTWMKMLSNSGAHPVLISQFCFFIGSCSPSAWPYWMCVPIPGKQVFGIHSIVLCKQLRCSEPLISSERVRILLKSELLDASLGPICKQAFQRLATRPDMLMTLYTAALWYVLWGGKFRTRGKNQ